MGDPGGGWERSTIAILGALVAFGPIAIDTYLPALPELADDLGSSATAVQVTLTACLLGLAVGQLIGGPISDARGRRGLALVGTAGFTAVSVACALAPSVWALIALRFLQGVAGGVGMVVAFAVVRDRQSGVGAARAYGVMQAISGLGPILAPVVGALVLHVTSWRGIFLLLGAIGAAVYVAALLGLDESLPPERRHDGELRSTLVTFRRLMVERRFVGYAIACAFPGAALFTYIAASPFVLQEVYGLSPQQYSLVFAVNSLGFVGCTLLGYRLVARVGPRALLTAALTAGLVAGLALVPLVLMDASLWLFSIAQFVIVACVGLVSPNGMALALGDHADAAGSAAALLGTFSLVLGGTVAPLVGLGGVDTALPFAVVVALLQTFAIVFYVWLTRAPEHGSPGWKERAWRGSS